jgi:hypothetical protein
MACEDGNCDCNKLKMDGSAGIGDLAKVTISRTDDVQGDVEENFIVPYVLIRFETLQLFTHLRQINGYSVKRLPKQ